MALYTLAPQPWLVFLDDAGLYVPNGQLAIYAAGTTTPAIVYTSASGTAHPFPITLDATGRVPGGLYLQPGLNYKFVLHAPMIEEPLDGAIIRTQDNVGATQATGSTISITLPGSYLLDASSVNVIEYTGVGDMHLRALAGGVQGQGLTVQNLSDSTIWLETNDPLAPPGAALVNLVSHGPMPLVGPHSNAHYVYLSGQWRMGTYEMGRPIKPPFTPADYSTLTAGVTWTVDPADIENEYFYLDGRNLLYGFRISTTTISGGTEALVRFLPYGWQCLFGLDVTAIVVTTDFATFPAGIAVGLGQGVAFQRLPFNTPWFAVTNAAGVYGQITVILN